MADGIYNIRKLFFTTHMRSIFGASNGDFYLEVHHLKQLADKGSYRIFNTLAVCPNCYKKLHFSEKKENLLQKLYFKIDRLTEE